MENTKNIEAQSALTPPLKSIVVNGKKKIAVNGVVNLNLNNLKGGVQPDWNQNDENAPDYIKNRICYAVTEGREYSTHSEGSEQISIPFGQYTFSADKYPLISTESLIGRQYTATFMGKPVSIVLTEDSIEEMAEGVYMFGEGNFLVEKELHKEGIDLYPGLYCVYESPEVGEIDYVLSAKDVDVQPIDKKFIPKIPTLQYLNDGPAVPNSWSDDTYDDNEKLICDFSSMEVGEVAKCYIYISMGHDVTLGFVDTDGNELDFSSNYSSAPTVVRGDFLDMTIARTSVEDYVIYVNVIKKQS